MLQGIACWVVFCVGAVVCVMLQRRCADCRRHSRVTHAFAYPLPQGQPHLHVKVVLLMCDCFMAPVCRRTSASLSACRLQCEVCIPPKCGPLWFAIWVYIAAPWENPTNPSCNAGLSQCMWYSMLQQPLLLAMCHGQVCTPMGRLWF